MVQPPGWFYGHGSILTTALSLNRERRYLYENRRKLIRFKNFFNYSPDTLTLKFVRRILSKHCWLTLHNISTMVQHWKTILVKSALWSDIHNHFKKLFLVCKITTDVCLTKVRCLTRVLYVNRAKKGGVRTCVNSCVKVFSMALNWLEQ